MSAAISFPNLNSLTFRVLDAATFVPHTYWTIDGLTHLFDFKSRDPIRDSIHELAKYDICHRNWYNREQISWLINQNELAGVKVALGTRGEIGEVWVYPISGQVGCMRREDYYRQICKVNLGSYDDHGIGTTDLGSVTDEEIAAFQRSIEPIPAVEPGRYDRRRNQFVYHLHVLKKCGEPNHLARDPFAHIKHVHVGVVLSKQPYYQDLCRDRELLEKAAKAIRAEFQPYRLVTQREAQDEFYPLHALIAPWRAANL